MTDSSSRGFLQSLALHAAAVALALGLGFVAANREPEVSRIIELVAGEGDNYAATEAPALGVEGGVKLSVPAAAAPRPEPPALLRPPEPEPEVAPVAPAPVAVPPPVPAAKAPPTPAPPPEKAPSAAGNEAVPNFKRKIQYEIVRGDAKAKLQLRREREAEQKRQAEERKRAAEDAKRMTKEEFDRAQRAKGGAAKGAPPKVARVDGEGIAKGVVGGSTANRKGGAGGKALTSSGEGVLDSYYAYFKRELRTAFEPPPGLSDSLKATLEVRSNPDGSLSNARITVPSGSREFDQAVLAAVRRVRMPARPSEHRAAETFEFVFTLRERDQG
ncbi:MAG: energy transducer TonB [Opitutaceae bacterium]